MSAAYLCVIPITQSSSNMTQSWKNTQREEHNKVNTEAEKRASSLHLTGLLAHTEQVNLLKTACGGNVKEVDAPAQGRHSYFVNISQVDSIGGPSLEALSILPFIKGAGTHLQGRGRGYELTKYDWKHIILWIKC